MTESISFQSSIDFCGKTDQQLDEPGAIWCQIGRTENMGLSDYFEPFPSIQCPHCGGGMEGWRGKHWGDCRLFVWRQGEIAPIGQKIDLDIRLDNAALASRRLERALIPISGAECARCGAQWRDCQFAVSADARSGTWIRTAIVPEPLIGTILEAEWIQCPQCTDAYAISAEQIWVICEPCGRLVMRGQRG